MYKLYNDNCFEILLGLPEASCSLVITDPPYGVSNNRININFNGKRADIIQDFGSWDIFSSESAYESFTTAWLKNVYRVLKPGRMLCFFFSLKKISLAERLINETGFLLKDYFFKVCSNPCPNFRKKGFWSAVEPVLICQKPGGEEHPYRSDLVGQPNYVRCGVVAGKQRTKHPTQKPIAAIEPLIKYWSKEGDLILDPFMGSNTTGVVAYSMNRRYIGIEVDKEYYEIGKGRLQDIQIEIEKKF